MAVLDVVCPRCNAKAGEKCWARPWGHRSVPHAEREARAHLGHCTTRPRCLDCGVVCAPSPGDPALCDECRAFALEDGWVQ